MSSRMCLGAPGSGVRVAVVETPGLQCDQEFPRGGRGSGGGWGVGAGVGEVPRRWVWCERVWGPRLYSKVAVEGPGPIRVGN